LCAAARSRALIAPAAGLTPAVWSSFLLTSQCCLYSQLDGAQGSGKSGSWISHSFLSLGGIGVEEV